ncbi:hypothetical protein GGF43_000122 [Coemansia sp. RSA 2618]|nr:hypothetical protein GGF43_000122 [Coemansia sp. RSA 2618]
MSCGGLSIAIHSANGRTTHTYELTDSSDGWRIDTGGGEPPLLQLVRDRGTWGQLTIDETAIPKGLGLVPAYVGSPNALRVTVRSCSALGQTGDADLTVAVSVQRGGEEASSQHLEVQREAATPGQRVMSAQWRAESSSAHWRAESSSAPRTQGGVVTVQIAGHAGSVAARFDFYAGFDGAAADRGPGDAAGAQHIDPGHVFSETLRHREQRKRGDDASSDSGNGVQHPLFGRWVTEDSPAFRKTIAAMEAQALASRAQYKELARQTAGLSEACQEFMRALADALSHVEALAVARPLVQAFIEPLKSDVAQLLSTVCTNWDAVVVTHARRLYEGAFRHLDERKAEFDAGSEQFYADMAKHLKAKASREDARRDEAFERSRMAFDASRWAYFLDLWTATHGWSELDMFVAVLKWAKSVARAREAARLPALSADGSALAWFLANIPAAFEEVRLQKSESTEFQAFVENPFGGVVREHALTPTGEEPEGDDYVRVSLENLVLAPQSVQLQRPPPMRQSASTGSVGGSFGGSFGGSIGLAGSATSDRRALRLSAIAPPPLEPMRSASGSSLDLARQLASVSLGRPLNIPPAASSSETLQRDGVREGVLYARVGGDEARAQAMTGRNMRAPTHSTWRQYWCVVRDGRFQKFTGWRESRMEPRGEPLNLSLATARVLPADAKPAGKRRFCFEIITPTYYGVFQAASAGELAAWVDVLRRAIELSLLQSGLPARASTSSEDPRAARFSRMSQLSGFDSASTLSPSGSDSAASLARRAADDAADDVALAAARRRLSVTGLLPMLQQDEANGLCADCGAAHPDWCSLNLGCLLCIECSGVHRSLGTHVSKVRSLTLDVTSFTPVTIAMLLLTGNALNRRVFEVRTLPPPAAQRPGADSAAAARQQFIASKYVRRVFVDRQWRPDGRLALALGELARSLGEPAIPAHAWDRRSSTCLLLAAIAVGDIGAVMRAVSLDADVPGTFKASIGGAFAGSEHATPLLAALFGAELGCAAAGGSVRAHAEDSADGGSVCAHAEDSVARDSARAQLEIAELLTLNGANINAQDADGRTPLHWACLANSSAAAKYLADKGANPLLKDSGGLRACDLIAEAHHAVRAVVGPATQRAEDRERREAASQRWASDGGDSGSLVGRSGRLLRRGSMGSISSGKWHEVDMARSDNPVISAARRFTQSLAPSGPSFASRMSVSTERPSLMELNGGIAGGIGGGDGRRAPRGGPNSGHFLAGVGSSHFMAAGGNGSSWLTALGTNKRGRRLTNGLTNGLANGLTNGIRDFGSRFGAPPRAADGMATIDEVPRLPTIMSARDDESIVEVIVESPAEQLVGSSVSAYSVPASPAIASGSTARLSTSAFGDGRPVSAAALSPAMRASFDDMAEHPTLTMSRHGSMRSAKQKQKQLSSSGNLPHYMYSSHGRSSSPVKLRSHLDISSAGSSFVDINSSDGLTSPLHQQHQQQQQQQQSAQLPPPIHSFGGQNNSKSNSRVSLGLFGFGGSDEPPSDRSGLMAKLMPGGRAGDNGSSKKRESRILLRRPANSVSNVLRPSSSADALSRVRIQEDVRPPTSDERLRSKLRLIPKTSRIALNGFFGRNKQSVHQEHGV